MTTRTQERKSFSEKKTELFKKGVTPATVYIGNMQYSKDEDEIKGMFQKFGNIKFVNVMKDPKTKKSKGFAFVRMNNIKDAERAIRFYDGKVYDGRTLKASIAQETEEAQAKKVWENKQQIRLQKEEEEQQRQPQKVKSRRSSPSKKEGLNVLFNFLEK